MGRRVNLLLFVSVILLVLAVTLQFFSMVGEVDYSDVSKVDKPVMSGQVIFGSDDSGIEGVSFFTKVWSGIKKVFSLTGYASYTAGSDVAVSTLFPTANSNVTEKTFFNVTFNVTCSLADCGDINVSLDTLGVGGGENPVSNGDFETGDLTGWTGSGHSINSGTVKSGSYSARAYTMDTGCGSGTDAYITQDITLTQAETLHFAYHSTSSSGAGFCDGPHGTGCEGSGSSATSDFNLGDGSTWLEHNYSLSSGSHTITWFTHSWCYVGSTLYVDDICIIDGSGNCKTGGVTWGPLTVTVGDTPFYTNSTTNPVTVNLAQDESATVKFWVNATGVENNVSEFRGQANITGDMATGDSTASFNLTIEAAPNVAPTTPTDLTFSNPYVNRDLTAVGSGSTDSNGDSLTYYYEFYNVNSSTTLQSYSTDNTYTPVATDENDTIEVRVKAFDGQEYSASSYSEQVFISPEPTTTITIDSLTISPSPARTINDLIATVKGVSSLGNPLSYYYNWTVDGAATGVEGVFDVGGMSASIYASFGVLSNGSFMSWGIDNNAELGNSGTNNHVVPTLVTPPQSFTKIEGGWYVNCGFSFDGDIYCWGMNTNGQVGNGGGSNVESPTLIDSGNSYLVINGGRDHTCGIRTDGSAYCWGLDTNGQLGNGALGSSSTPSPVSGGYTFSDICGGREHSCGILENGSAYCWGSNGFDQLGTNGGGNTNSPVFVSTSYLFSDIACGQYHSCGILENGSAVCWGRGIYGQLGDGATSDNPVPTFISGSSVFSSIDSLFDHTCAVKTDKSVSCWGENGYGELGNNGRPSDSSTPVAVSSSFSFSEVHTGYRHTCGMLENGTAMCWGSDEQYQIGSSSVSTYTAVPLFTDYTGTFGLKFFTSGTFVELPKLVASYLTGASYANISVWATDGSDNSSVSTVGVVFVSNNLPTTPTTLTLATSPFNVTDTVTATCSGSTDLDNDTISYYVEFYNLNSSSIVQAYSTDNTYVLQTSDTRDNIQVKCKSYDGYNYSSSFKDANLTVVNSAPTTPTSLTYSTPIRINKEVVLTGSGSTDLDSDTITYYYEFYNVNESTIRQAYSIDNSWTTTSSDEGDLIEFRVKAYDGDVYSNVYSEQILVLSAAVVEVEITDPVNSSARSVTIGENISVYFNVLEDGVNMTSGVTISSIKIGGQEVAIANGGGASNSTSFSDDLESGWSGTGDCPATSPYDECSNTDGDATTGDMIRATLANQVYSGTTSFGADDFDPPGNSYALNKTLDLSSCDEVYVNVVYSGRRLDAGDFGRLGFWDSTNGLVNVLTVDNTNGGCNGYPGDADGCGWTPFSSKVTSNNDFSNPVKLVWGFSMAGGGEAVFYDELEILCETTTPVSFTDFSYVSGKGWEANVTVPMNLSGLQDLEINATYTGNYSGISSVDLELNALDISADDTTPPVITDIANVTVTEFESVYFDVNATDNFGIDVFTVNDSDFSIDSNGVLTNATTLSAGYHYLNITVNDTSGNIDSEIIWVWVKDYVVFVSNPRTASPMSVNVSDNITVGFDYLFGGINVTSGVTLENVTVGGQGFIGAPISDTVTFYYNSYSSSNAISPANLVDGSTSTYAGHSTGDSSRLNSLNYVSQSGTITKVEFRVYGYSDFMAATLAMQPYYSGTTAGQQYTYSFPTSATWTSYYDITSSTNAPSTWSWSDLENMDFNVAFSSGFTSVQVAKVEVRVTYDYQTGPSAYYSNGWKIDLENLPDLSGLQDLFIEATYDGVTKSDNEVDSLSFPAPDSEGPTFDDLMNLLVEYGQSLSHDFDATDVSGIDTFWVNDTTNFKIDSNGLLENNTVLSVGEYSLRIYVNDTLGNQNSGIIKVTVYESGDLYVLLVSPTGGPNSQPQNEEFTLRANVTCSGNAGATCGNVNGYLRYNSSSNNPDSNVVGSGVSSTPFYTTESNPRTCGNLDVGDNTCQLVWTVNATGVVGQLNSLDVLFTGSLASAGNDTFDTLIKVISPTLSIVLSNDLFNVDFGGGLSPGTQNNPAVDNSAEAYNITCLHSQGACNVSIKGNSDLASGGNVIGVGNVTWNGVNDNSTETPMTLAYDVINSALGDLATQKIFFWLDLPGEAYAGDYRSNFTIYGQSS